MQTVASPLVEASPGSRPHRSVAELTRARLREDWPWLVAVLVSALVTLGHAPYRDEWQAWMIARDAGSPLELLDNLRYEGHPWLWYSLIWVASRISRDILAAQVVCILIAAATQYVIWRHAPFPRRARMLLILGYFVAYEYAVFVRAYGLGVLLLVLAAVAITDERHGRAGVLLGLACLTSAFAAVVAVAVALPYWGPRVRSMGRRELGGLAAAFAGLAVAYVMTRPPADALNTGWRTSFDTHWARLTTSGPWRGILPMRRPYQPWNQNAVPPPWSSLLGVMLVVAGGLAFRPSRQALRTWVLGSALIAALTYGKGFAYSRHVGHSFVLAVLCAWILCSEQRPTWLLRRLAAAVLAVGLVANVQAALSERAVPISAAPAAAAWIDANLPDDAVYVGETDWSSAAVAGALDRPFWYPRTGETGTFIRWYDGYRDLGQREIEQRALAYAANTDRPVYLVIAFDPLEPSPHLEPLAEFSASHVHEERYWIYRLVP